MGNLKETFLKKYGVGEYLLLIVGLFVCYKGIRTLLYMDLENVTWDSILIVVFILLFGALFIAAPMSILDIARRKLGATPKAEK